MRCDFLILNVAIRDATPLVELLSDLPKEGVGACRPFAPKDHLVDNVTMDCPCDLVFADGVVGESEFSEEIAFNSLATASTVS